MNENLKITRCRNYNECNNMATLRYTECNPCRKQRNLSLMIQLNPDKQIQICSGGCGRTITDEKFKTCDICRSRKSKSVCKICKDDVYLNKYCEKHYNEFRKTTNVIKLNNKDDLKENNSHLHQEKYDNKYFIENAIDKLTGGYLGGLFDGDGSFIIHKLDSGYQLSVQLSQSVKNILILLQQKYGGYIYGGKRKNNNQRINYAFRLCGKNALRLLLDIKDHIILKYHQLLNCIDFITSISTINNNEIKELHYIKNRQLNNFEIVLDKPLDRLNDNYIAGIFDAEGCIGIMRRNNTVITPTLYAQISQKNHPIILEKIKEYLGFGKIKDDLKWHTDKYDDLDIFLNHIEGKIIIKQYQYICFKEFLDSCKKFGSVLTTDELNHRLFLHKEIHDDKHIDRLSINTTNILIDDTDNISDFSDDLVSDNDDNDDNENEEINKNFFDNFSEEINKKSDTFSEEIFKPKLTFKKKKIIEPKLTLKFKKNIQNYKNKDDKKLSTTEKTILNNKLAHDKIKSEWDNTHEKTVKNIGEKNPNFGKSFDYEHKLKISLANSARTVKLTREQFVETRKLLKNKHTIISIAKKFKCDRNFIAKIKNGYKHPDEVMNLSSIEFKEYEDSYLKPFLLKKN